MTHHDTHQELTRYLIPVLYLHEGVTLRGVEDTMCIYQNIEQYIIIGQLVECQRDRFEKRRTRVDNRVIDDDVVDGFLVPCRLESVSKDVRFQATNLYGPYGVIGVAVLVCGFGMILTANPRLWCFGQLLCIKPVYEVVDCERSLTPVF